MWQSLDWREISDVLKHIPQSGLGFLIPGVRRQQRGEEKSRAYEWFSESKESIQEPVQGQNYNPWASVEATSWSS